MLTSSSTSEHSFGAALVCYTVNESQNDKGESTTSHHSDQPCFYALTLALAISFQQMNSLEVCSSKIIYIYPIFNIDLQFQSVSHLKISATCVIKTDEDVYCYVWNETGARRGASEIASCVFENIV